MEGRGAPEGESGVFATTSGSPPTPGTERAFPEVTGSLGPKADRAIRSTSVAVQRPTATSTMRPAANRPSWNFRTSAIETARTSSSAGCTSRSKGWPVKSAL